MALWVVKVKTTKNMFRIFVPMGIIRKRLWGDTEYVLVDDSDPNKLVLRRFIDGEYLKGNGSKDKS